MKNSIYKCYFTAFALLTLLLCGCIREGGDNKSGKKELVKVRVDIPNLGSSWSDTRADEPEIKPDGIDEVYMIVFDTDGNVVRRHTFTNDPDGTVEIPGGSDVVSVEHEIELLSESVYDFFFAANMDGYYSALDQVQTVQDLKTIQISKISPASDPSSTVPEYPEGELNYEKWLNPFPRTTYVSGVWVIEDPVGSGYGKVSYDGNNLESSFEVFVDRIAPKINLSIRKMTGDKPGTYPEDRIYITDLRVLRVPNFAYMISSPYTGSAFNTMVWYEWVANPGLPNEGKEDNDYFTENNNGNVGGTGIYTYNPPGGGDTQYYTRSNRVDVVIPEYIMADNTIEQNAIVLEMRGDYEQWVPDGQGGGEYAPAFEDVWTLLPLYTGENSGGTKVYDFKRNNEYHFLITITGVANYEFQPNVTLVVSGWDNENDPNYNGGNENVSLSGNWTFGNGSDTSDIYVNANSYVEYTFSFSRTGSDNAKVNWRAALSNPVDFNLLTTGGALTGGWASPGDVIKVRVAPTAASSEANMTKLYINIGDGNGGTIKLALDPSDRYVIHQNPQ